ncbi:capsid protein [Rhodobacteraceae bacterium M382]|nr:capsid protein [Rhodobacteraceae bacterium M382]
MAPRRPFETDAALTAIAIGYKNPAASRIADQVMPRVSVGDEKFGYTVYPKDEAFQIPDARVGRKGRVTQMEFTGTRKTDAVEDYGLDAPIPYSDIEAAANARSRGVSRHDPEGRAVEVLSETILNLREIRVANMVQDATNYDADLKVALAGTDKFSDYTNSNPIDVIKEGLEKTFILRPNTVVFSRSTWSKTSSHPHLVNAVRGNLTDKGMISTKEFVDLFADEGIQRVLIGDAMFNAAKKGQPADMQKAWGNNIAMLHIDPMADTDNGVTWGFTAEYGQAISGRIEDPDIGLEGGFRIRRGERVKELIIAPEVGYLIQNVI